MNKKRYIFTDYARVEKKAYVKSFRLQKRYTKSHIAIDLAFDHFRF